MRNVSIAVLISALAFSTLAIGAGVSTTVGGAANTATSAATGNGSTSATTAASGQLAGGASASAGGVSVGASTSASADASAGASASEPNTSSVASGVSSIASSALSGESSMASSASSMSCDQVTATGVSMGAIDPAALAAVTNVAVFPVGSCSGLPSGTLDAGAGAALGGNPNVTAALKSAGYTGGQVVGYTLSGTSLTVYVKQ